MMNRCHYCGVAHPILTSGPAPERSSIHDAERAVLKACEVAWEAQKALRAESTPAEYAHAATCHTQVWRAVERMVEGKK